MYEIFNILYLKSVAPEKKCLKNVECLFQKCKLSICKKLFSHWLQFLELFLFKIGFNCFNPFMSLC